MAVYIYIILLKNSLLNLLSTRDYIYSNKLRKMASQRDRPACDKLRKLNDCRYAL